ncbi:inversin-like [Lineus longissimus]|uniref:inversin-like n=1 Tax=Lineus longissimus TaxID=88925 RepID=UPI002B4F0A35
MTAVARSHGKQTAKMDLGGPLPSAGVEAVTQMHAAAVNGDKSMLAKLIVASTRDIDVGDQFGRTPLMFCVLADRPECAELLLKAGASVDKKDRGGRTALHWAAHKGNFKLLRVLLSKGALWKEKDNEGQTPLHLSTRHKSPKCLALLMKHVGIGEIDDQDKNKRTALHWSSSYGNLEHIKMLIKQDSNIGIPDTEGKTPLHWAASSHDSQAVNCVNLLLETAPSVINWQDYEGRTALHLAVADGNEAVCDALTSLEKCSVSALDNMFRTPLHWAAVLGHANIVNLLLNRNADYSSSDSNGATPLHYAAQNNYSETVEVFLKRREIRDEPDVDGRTAFMWAAGKGANDVIETWVKYGGDIHEVDKNGGTALHAAAVAGHATTVKLLLAAKASIDGTDLMKHTPLFRACEMGHTDVVQTLIDLGARVDMLDQDGRSPLHWAALGGHAYICQILIKYGVDPNIRDLSGRTPLQCAAYGGFVNCMSVLIEHQSDPNAQDNEGMTALHWGCSKGHLDAVKLLLEYHAFPNHMEFTEDRYTPLDYALIGEHHDVAQFMMEQGGLSISGIQEIAAAKIQSYFRGFRVRKTFLERKKLLMKHDQLRKDAAKKRAEEEYKKKEDIRNKREVEERRRREEEKSQVAQSRASSATVQKPSTPSTTPRVETVSMTGSGTTGSGMVRSSRKKRNKELTEEEKILIKRQEKKEIVDAERMRQAEFRRKWKAAVVIQRCWRYYLYFKKGLMKKAADNIRTKRLAAGEEEWYRQIAALTIQLAWRKYYRRKLMRSLTPRSRHIMHMWDPEVIATKQRAMLRDIYCEELQVPVWHPKLHPPVRPSWFKYIPSPAALSFNFAVDQYHPLVARRGSSRLTYMNDNSTRVRPFSMKRESEGWCHVTDEASKELHGVKLSDKADRSKTWSYNMREF